jgi:cytochrome subunit of sulfide dehydrogenase
MITPFCAAPRRPLTRRKPVSTLGTCLALALALSSGHAQTNVPNGRLLASNCFQCHGTSGKGPGFETLAGKSAVDIYGNLKEFQSGLGGSGIMAKHAMGYTDTQLLALSQWLATQR